MAKTPAAGTTTWSTHDFQKQAMQDAMRGRTTLSGVPAAKQAAYTEAYKFGQWFNLQINRNAI